MIATAHIGKTYPSPIVACDKVRVLSEGFISKLELEKRGFLINYKNCSFKVLEYKNRGAETHLRLEVTPQEMEYKEFLTYGYKKVDKPQPFLFTVAEHRIGFGIYVENETYRTFYVPVKRKQVGWKGYNFDINLLTGLVVKNDQMTPWER